MGVYESRGQLAKLMKELGDKWAKLLEISDADGLQIRFALAGRRLVTGVSS